MQMFSIEALPDRPGMGSIVIGDFQEFFTLELTDWSPADYRSSWCQALAELLSGSQGVALMTWCARPPANLTRRAWTLHRDGERVIVQERIFVPEHHSFNVDATGRVVDLAPRETISADGEPVSHWVTTVDALAEFLRRTTAV